MDFSNPNTKNPHSAQLRANLGAPSFWLKGNTRDQTQFDLAFNRSIKPHTRMA